MRRVNFMTSAALRSHGPLLAEARQSCYRVIRGWHCFRDRLATRMRRRSRYCAGFEVVSITSFDGPQVVVDRWLRKRRIRKALLNPGLELGAVGVAAEQEAGRACVILLLARSESLPAIREAHRRSAGVRS
jgi:hypothetical protein